MAETSHRLDLKSDYVVAEWVDDDGQKQYLPSNILAGQRRLKFELAFDVSLSTSFCKLQFPFRTSKSNISLLVPLKQVTAMDLRHQTPGDVLPMEVRRYIGPKAYCLRFSMSSPPSYVASEDDLAPQNDTFTNHLSLVQTLSHSTNFTLYLNRMGHLAAKKLQTICDTISRSGVLSIPNGEYPALLNIIHLAPGTYYK